MCKYSMGIEVQGIEKTFGNTKALKGISFEVEEGEIFGLLGPNGAGKTTTVKILATMLLPDKGRALIRGSDVVKHPKEARDLVDVITARDKFYRRLNGYQNIKFFSRLYQVDDWEGKMEKYGDHLGLTESDFEKRLADYSTGMRQKLNLIRNMVRETPILFLDEPTLGLDPVSSRKFRSLLKEIMEKEDKTVIFTSHNMFEVEELCERIAILKDGKITMTGDPEKLKDQIFPKRMIEFSFKDGSDLDLEHDHIYKIEKKKDGKTQVYINAGDHVHDVVQEILNQGRVSHISVKEPTLEEAFIKHAGEQEETNGEVTSWR